MTTANTETNNSVTWASSEPFNVPAYVTGEWGEYVLNMEGPQFTSNLEEAKVLSVTEQQEFNAQYQGAKRFYAAAEYFELLQRADEARGF